MAVSFRLTPQTRTQLLRLARETGLTQSALIREALDLLARDRGPGSEAKRPYDAVAHLVGCARGGPTDLSVRTGERFREMLGKRKNRK